MGVNASEMTLNELWESYQVNLEMLGSSKSLFKTTFFSGAASFYRGAGGNGGITKIKAMVAEIEEYMSTFEGMEDDG